MERFKVSLVEKVEEEMETDLRSFQLSSSVEPAIIRQRNNSDIMSQGIATLSTSIQSV